MPEGVGEGVSGPCALASAPVTAPGGAGVGLAAALVGLRGLPERSCSSERRVGSDAPGLPFGGCPGFLLYACGGSVKKRRSSRRLSRPFRALTHTFPAAIRRVEEPARTGTTHARITATLMSNRSSTAYEVEPVLFRGRGCQVPPESARSVQALSANRPLVRPTDPTVPDMFQPGHAHELPPSGRSADRRSGSVTGTLPSVPFGAALWRRVRLRRVDPSGKPPRARLAPHRGRALLALSPLRRYVSSSWHRLPGASSHVLGGTWVVKPRRRRALSAIRTCTSESCRTTNLHAA